MLDGCGGIDDAPPDQPLRVNAPEEVTCALDLMRILLGKDTQRFLVWFLREGLLDTLRRLSATKTPEPEEEEKSAGAQPPNSLTGTGILSLDVLM